MLERVGAALVGAAVSVVMIPVAIVLTTIVLLVFSLPFRLFKATHDPHVAVGIPAVGFAIWTLWYGEVGLFRVMLQYGFASMLAGAFWDMRDGKKEQKRQQAVEREVDAVIPRPSAAKATTPPALPGAGTKTGGSKNATPIAERSAAEIVKEVLSEVDRAEARLADILALPPDLIREVRRQISDAARTVHTVRVDGVSPRNVAWLVISNVAGEMVACGEHHIYRGVLGMTGQALQQAFHRAIDELEKGGLHDAAATNKDREWLRERIKDAG